MILSLLNIERSLASRAGQSEEWLADVAGELLMLLRTPTEKFRAVDGDLELLLLAPGSVQLQQLEADVLARRSGVDKRIGGRWRQGHGHGQGVGVRWWLQISIC